MRKPPCWVRSVFQCSLCTLLCASWSHGFVWLQKHKVTRQTSVTFPWVIYLQCNSECRTILLYCWSGGAKCLLSFFLHSGTSTPAPNPLDLNSDTRGDKRSRTAFTPSPPGLGSWSGEGGGHVWSDTCLATSNLSWASQSILQLCVPLSVLLETLNPPSLKQGGWV